MTHISGREDAVQGTKVHYNAAPGSQHCTSLHFAPNHRDLKNPFSMVVGGGGRSNRFSFCFFPSSNHRADKCIRIWGLICWHRLLSLNLSVVSNNVWYCRWILNNTLSLNYWKLYVFVSDTSHSNDLYSTDVHISHFVVDVTVLTVMEWHIAYLTVVVP